MQKWKLRFEPRPWQRRALKAWLRDRRGTVSVVTGGGKTIFAEICILEFLKSTASGQVLILVPTISLLDQWIVSLVEELGVEEVEIGLLSGQEKINGDEKIVIAVLNSARKFSEKFSQNREIFLIVDECHRAGSPINARALNGNYAATLGLSATPEREYDEGFEEFIVPRIGPIIFEYSYEDASNDGVISSFGLINVQVEMLPDEQRNFDKLSRAIAREFSKNAEDFNNNEKLKRLFQRRAAVSATATMRIPVAVKLVESHRGERSIIFHERIDAAEKILDLLQERGHRAAAYHAQLGPHIRRDNLRLFRRGVFDVLVCCRALDEGMNVPETAVAVIASSTASKRQRIQRLGRILRPAKGKNFATVYTIFASDQEKERLEIEAARIGDLASVDWRRGRVRSEI